MKVPFITASSGGGGGNPVRGKTDGRSNKIRGPTVLVAYIKSLRRLVTGKRGNVGKN